MQAARTLGIVVNAAGIQERRANMLAPHLSRWFRVDVLIQPSPRRVARAVSGWDALYVIDPGAAGFPAAAIAKGRRRAAIVEVGDPQKELYAAQGRGWITQVAGGVLDAAVACYADGVVVRGEALAATLNVTVPWVTIPDGVDVDRFQPTAEGFAIRRSAQIRDDALVVGVVGSIQWAPRREFAYGLDVIDAAARLPSGRIHVLIVGDGTGLPYLKQRAIDHGMHNVHFAGRVAHDRVPGFMAAMDVCVSTQTRDEIGMARTTAKLPEYLACDRFVLATAVGTAAQILPREMLLDSDLADWAAHVGHLRARLEALLPLQPRLRLGVGSRALALEHFAYPMLGHRLGEFLDACMSTRAPLARAGT